MTRRRRTRTWLVYTLADGRVEVVRNGRTMFTGAPEAARRRIRSQQGPADKIFDVEPDGYRTEITRRL